MLYCLVVSIQARIFLWLCLINCHPAHHYVTTTLATSLDEFLSVVFHLLGGAHAQQGEGHITADTGNVAEYLLFLKASVFILIRWTQKSQHHFKRVRACRMHSRELNTSESPTEGC